MITALRPFNDEKQKKNNMALVCQ